MMNNQEIIDNAPEGATHFNDDYVQYLRASKNGYMEQDTVNEEWDYGYSNHCKTRSLADIKNIVELEDIMFDLLSLSSFAMSFPFEYDKLEALRGKP
jgi:hypothetical protein